MAIHTDLPIYKAAYKLLDATTDIVKHMDRSYKRSIGEKITNECIEIVVLVFRANVAQEKEQYLVDLLERVQVINLMLRLGVDKGIISRSTYAKAIELTTAIGKQANGWRRAARRPLHGG